MKRITVMLLLLILIASICINLVNYNKISTLNQYNADMRNSLKVEVIFEIQNIRHYLTDFDVFFKRNDSDNYKDFNWVSIMSALKNLNTNLRHLENSYTHFNDEKAVVNSISDTYRGLFTLINDTYFYLETSIPVELNYCDDKHLDSMEDILEEINKYLAIKVDFGSSSHLLTIEDTWPILINNWDIKKMNDILSCTEEIHA